MEKISAHLGRWTLYGWALSLFLILAPTAGWGLQFYTDPFLQAATPDSITVVWITDEAGTVNQVEYGPGLVSAQAATTTSFTRLANAYRHQALISGLTSDTSYDYRVVTDDLTSETFTLRTPPVSGGVRLLLISDAQRKTMVDDTMQAVEQYGGPLDAILFAGDLVDKPDTVDQWWGSLNAPLDVMTGRNVGGSAPGGKLLQYIPLYPSLGNHEYRSAGVPGDFDALTYQEMFTLPTGADPRGWYSFDLGNTHIVNLTVAQYWASKKEDRWIFEEIRPGSDQYNWLVADLSTHTSEFTVVQFHLAVYTEGHSADTPFDWPWPTDEDQIVDYLVPLFEQYGVDLVLSGHDHLYEHYQENGIHYLQSSNIGSTYGIQHPERHGKVPVKQLSASDIGYFSILDTTGLGTVTTYRNDGQIMEQFTLHALPEQPDLCVRQGMNWLGDNIYNDDGTDQTIQKVLLPSSTTVRYYARLYNDGDEPEAFWIRGPAGDAFWTVRYYWGTIEDPQREVTALVTRPKGWKRSNVPLGAKRAFLVTMTPKSTGKVPNCTALVLAQADRDPTLKDALKMIARVK